CLGLGVAPVKLTSTSRRGAWGEDAGDGSGISGTEGSSADRPRICPWTGPLKLRFSRARAIHSPRGILGLHVSLVRICADRCTSAARWEAAPERLWGWDGRPLGCLDRPGGGHRLLPVWEIPRIRKPRGIDQVIGWFLQFRSNKKLA